ncbi:MAG: thymidylate kinase Tmk [Pseudomonadota bacterium]|jgi:dTMP kinase
MAGRFLVLEGIDGAGKSTHLAFICQWLRDRGHVVVQTREPGGSLLAEAVRAMVLREPMDELTELLLIFAARRDHLVKTIDPALARGDWVVCDRFTDSTRAYQGAGRGLSAPLIETLAQEVEQGSARPDFVFYFDLPPEEAALRRRQRSGGQLLAEDRFDAEDLAFFSRVRAGYQAAAQARQGACQWIDARETIAQIQARLQTTLLSID